MGIGGFFGSGGSTYETTSKTGLAQYPDIGANVARYLGTNIPAGGDFALRLLQNPSSFLDVNGLFPGSGNMFNSIVGQAISKMSGAAGARGQQQQENIPAIAGSAATNAAGTILPLAQSNFGNLMSLGANLFSNLLGTGAGALGSTSTGTGTSMGPGIGYNMANDAFKNLTQWLSPSAAYGGGATTGYLK